MKGNVILEKQSKGNIYVKVEQLLSEWVEEKNAFDLKVETKSSKNISKWGNRVVQQ